MRTISLTVMRAIFGQETDETPVVLITIETEEGEILRLSSDPTTKLQDDPVIYGTHSGGHEYLFAMMSATIPDDLENAPISVPLTFENVSSDIVAIVRSTTTPTDVTMQVVLASAPDAVLVEYTGLQTVKANYDALTVQVEISRERITTEIWPGRHMTRNLFPGLT